MVDSDDEEIESSEDEVEEDEVGEDEDDLDEEEAPKEKTSMGWKAQEKQLKENETKFDKFRCSFNKFRKEIVFQKLHLGQMGRKDQTDGSPSG